MKIAKYLFMPENLAIKSPRYVAGADVSYGKHGEQAFAAVVVVDITTGKVKEKATWVGKPEFTYRSGFFALREIPCLFKVFEKLEITPDLVLIDGNGLIHQRRFGLACHIGLCLDIPTIGCAKSLLVGNHKPLSKKEPTAIVRNQGETLGVALRKYRNVTYVSIGHKVDLTFAKNFIFNLDKPTPIDHAHDECSILFKKYQKQEINEKDKIKLEVISLAKEFKNEGLSYTKIACELNKYKDLRKAYGHKFMPKKIRNWLEK